MAEEEKKKVRAHVIISGRVQGVFFRMNTVRAAERIGGVSGWVKNRRDGAVEAVLEGEAGPVEALIHWFRQGDPPAVVSDVHIKWEDFSGEYVGFSVAY